MNVLYMYGKTMNTIRYFLIAIPMILCTMISYSQTIPVERVNGVPGAIVTGIAELKDKSIVVSTLDGIWQTNDRLKTWEKISTWSRDTMVYCVASGSNGEILAGTSIGLMRRASGNTQAWQLTKVNGLNPPVRYLKSYSSGLVFMGTKGKLFRSQNNGVNWTSLADSLMKVMRPNQIGIAVLGQNNRIHIGQWYSDNGIHWRNISKITAASYPLISGMYADAKGKVIINLRDSISFSQSSELIEYSHNNGLAYSSRVLHAKMSTDDKGNYVSYSNLFSAESVDNYMLRNPIIMFGDTVCIAKYGLGILYAKVSAFINPEISALKKNGNSFERIPIPYSSCILTLSDSTVLLGTYGGGIYESSSRGFNFKKTNFTAESPIVTSMTPGISSNAVQYVGTLDGLYQTFDGRKSWKRIDTSFRFGSSTLIPITDSFIIATTYNEVYIKTPSAAQWQRCDSCADYFQTSMCGNDSALYFIKPRDTKNSVLLESLDKGKSWTYQSIIPNNGSDFWTMFFDTQTKSLYRFSSAGIISRSQNGGKTWTLHKNDTLYITISGKPVVASVYGIFKKNTSLYLRGSQGIYVYNILTNTWANKFPVYKPAYYSTISGVNQQSEMYGVDEGNIFKTESNKTSEKIAVPHIVYSLGIDSLSHLLYSTITGDIFVTKNPTVIVQTPIHSFPQDKTKNIGVSVKLEWDISKQIGNFELRFSDDTTFTSNQTQTFSTTAKSISVGNLLVDKTYYWQVRQVADNLKSPWSTPYSLSTIVPAPSKPDLLQPNNNAKDIVETQLFEWQSLPFATHYELQLAENNNFSTIIVQDSLEGKTTREITDLKKSMIYYWRVRGINKGVIGTWSDVWSFTTQSPSGIREDDNLGMSVTVQNSHVILHYGAYSQSVKGIRITDIRGKTILSQTIEQGQSSSDFDMSGMSKGYYVVILDTHTGSISRNVIVE